MRTKKAIINIIISILVTCSSLVFGFVGQKIFLRNLGVEYAGLNGLYSNIISMLGIFELGIGNTIAFYLYGPIANDNKEKIKTLMFFYKKTYKVIAIIVFSVGMLLLPFLKFIVKGATIDVNIYVAYFLFLVSTVCSYIMVYKRTLVIADQKNYVVNIIHLMYLLLLNISQIAVLILYKNYYLYLLCRIVCQIFSNVVITIYVNKKYPYIKEKTIAKLEDGERKHIFNGIEALIFHKIGGVVVNSTDNIIISYFLGIITVGLYSNYANIVNAVQTIINNAITSINSSVGNLLTTNNEDNIFSVFNRIRFMNFWISCFASISLLIITKPFIVLWIGERYLLSDIVLIVLVLNLFQTINRCTYNVFKNAAGIWVEDWFVPILEATTNIVFSVIFLKKFGLAGVFMGTITSSLVLWLYSYPKFVYKKIFKKSYLKYCKETSIHLIIFMAMVLVSILIGNYIYSQEFGIWIKLLISIFCAIVIPNTAIVLIYHNNSDYIYYIKLMKKIIKKRCKIMSAVD